MTRRKGRNGTPYNRTNPLFQGSPLYWNTATYNSRLYMMFRQQLVGIAMSRFKWVNVPKTIDTRYLEWTLLTQGVATISHPKAMPKAYYGTQVAYSGALNVYDNPVKWQSIGNNGWRFNANPKSGVIIWDNMERICIMDWLELYALELCDIMRTKQMNRMHQKIPYILKGEQRRKQDMVNLYRQVVGGEPAVIATDGIEAIDVDALDTRVPYIGDKLNEEWENIWNSAYTMLGIDSLPYKAERRITSEVDSMTMPTTLASLGPLNARRQALEKLKELDEGIWGDVSVVWANDTQSSNYNVMHDLKTYSEVMGDLNDNTTGGMGELDMDGSVPAREPGHSGGLARHADYSARGANS